MAYKFRVKCFLLFAVAAALLFSVSPASAQQLRVAVFDFDSNGDASFSWFGPCLAGYAIKALRTAPGVSVYARNDLKRQIELIGFSAAVPVPFEKKESVLSSLGGNTFVEGAFSAKGNFFSFTGTVVRNDTGDVKDISFSLKDFTLEKVQAELALKIADALRKKIGAGRNALWGTGSKQAYTGYWQALFVYEKGETEKARKLLDGTAAADGSFVEPLLLLARIYMEKTLFSKAISQLEQCLKLNAKNPEIRYQLGLTYMFMSRNTEARAYLKAASDMDPGNAEYHWQLGVLYKATLNPDKALDELKRAVMIAPGMAQAWYELASMYALAGSKDRAMDCIENILKFGRQTYYNRISNDADFNSLRNEKRFKELMRKYH